MWDKIKYYFLVGLMFGGCFVVVGSAGASDLDEISAEGFAVRAIVGFVMLLVGMIGLKKGGYLEN